MTKVPDTQKDAQKSGDRIAKIMARAGLCSRREAEQWIADGRVTVNGRVLKTPAVVVADSDTVLVDGQPLPKRERTRLWTYHKPRGLVTTTHDPEGRPTVFDNLPADLPRVITIGRLDINTEGLLLLTNDGGLARVLELPTTGWMRRYRVRAHGVISQEKLDTLGEGFAVDGILYGPIEAKLDRTQGQNVWLTLGLREGKNREVKRVLEALGLTVNRLIRVSYGPFQLGDSKPGEVSEVRGRVLRDQLGERLRDEAGTDFEAPVMPRVPAPRPQAAKAQAGAPKPQGKPGDKPSGPKSRSDKRRSGPALSSRREEAVERSARPRKGAGGAPGRPAGGAAAQGRSSQDRSSPGRPSQGRPGQDRPSQDRPGRGKGPGRPGGRPGRPPKRP